MHFVKDRAVEFDKEMVLSANSEHAMTLMEEGQVLQKLPKAHSRNLSTQGGINPRILEGK